MPSMKALGLGLLVWAPVMADFKYTGCDTLKNSDFKSQEIVKNLGLAGAMQMDFQPVMVGDSVARTNIFLIERLGKVKFYDAAAGTLTLAGQIPVWGQGDAGLMGIALHPDFAHNRWMYLWICPTPPTLKNDTAKDNHHMKLSRFTVTDQNTLDMNSEKVLIDVFGSKTAEWHHGGPMTFDAYGDLWVTIGNDSKDVNNGSQLSTTDSSASAEWGSSNTASMRGGIIRIHPDSSDLGYSVPAGNFGEYWAGEFQKRGRDDLAALYRDPAKVLPEVYIKGSRSNWSVTVHPTKRWVAWGEVSFSNTFDEFNITDHPIFAGFPYFHADNLKVPGANKIAAAPMNNSPFNSGVKELPPAIPGTVTELTNVAITGPIYVFDRNLKSSVKFPPHLHQSWMNMSFQESKLWMQTLDSNTLAVTRTQRVDNGIFKGLVVKNPLQAKYGPDGSLYILNYFGLHYDPYPSGVTHITYTGSCKVAPSPVSNVASRPPDIAWLPDALIVNEIGTHEFSVHSLAGKCLGRQTGAAGQRYGFRALRQSLALRPGLYILSVKSQAGVYARKVALM